MLEKYIAYIKQTYNPLRVFLSIQRESEVQCCINITGFSAYRHRFLLYKKRRDRSHAVARKTTVFKYLEVYSLTNTPLKRDHP